MLLPLPCRHLSPPRAQTCEVDSDFTAATPFNFHCVNTLAKDDCVGKGGDFQEERKGDDKCVFEEAKKAGCDALGGKLEEGISCAEMSQHYAPSVTSKEQCSVIVGGVEKPASWVIEYIGSRCCGGNDYNLICVRIRAVDKLVLVQLAWVGARGACGGAQH